MNDCKRFEALLEQLSFVVDESRRHRVRLIASKSLNALVELLLLDGVFEAASEARHALFSNIGSPFVPPFGYEQFTARCQKQATADNQSVEEVATKLLMAGETIAKLSEQLIRTWIKPLPGSTLREAGIIRAVFTSHRWYTPGHGYVPFSWHKSEEEAQLNAAITGGVVATVEIDRDGDYFVPLEERLKLGVSSLAV